DTIQYDPAFTTALDFLKEPVRGRLLREIDDLIDEPEARPNVTPSRWAGARYELRPEADPSLVVLFEPHEDTRVVEVVDMIRPDALLSILRGTASSSPSP